MRAVREKAVTRHDVERCLVKLESRVMTVKGLYPLVATEIRVRLIKIPVYTNVS